MQEPHADRSWMSRRWEYQVGHDEHLGDILEQIRRQAVGIVLLDISRHDALRKDGALRRTLEAAAAELGKQVVFSFHQQDSSSSRGQPAIIPITVVQSRAPPQRGGHPPGREVPRIRLGRRGRRLALAFTLLAGALTAVVAVFLVPHAVIDLWPRTEPVSLALSVRASVTATDVDPTRGVLPARIQFLEEIVERAFPVQHTVNRGEHARGMVQIVNRTGTEQRIKAGSRLRAGSGGVYRTQEAHTVPPRGTIDAAVVADDAGGVGNLADGTLSFVALSRDAQAVLFAAVRQPLRGGTDRLVKQLSEEDLQRAAEQLLSESGAVLEKLRAQLPAGTFQRPELQRVEVLDARPRESLGDELQEFHLQTRLRASVFAIHDRALVDLLTAMTLASSENKRSLGRPLAGTSVRVEGVDWDKGTADFATHVENTTVAQLDLAVLKKRLVGRTAEGAAEYLRGLPEMQDVRVRLRPFWVRRVPFIPRNVIVTVHLPGE